MARCNDCVFFEIQTWGGREPKSCAERGEKAINQACDNFKDTNEKLPPEELDSKIPEELRPIVRQIGALQKIDYKKVGQEILAESFVLEQDLYIAVKDAQAMLQVQGAKVTIDEGRFHRYVDRLTDLWILHRLVLAMGFGGYIDTIMEREIANKFPPPIPHQPKPRASP